jgi:hypothetical protein
MADKKHGGPERRVHVRVRPAPDYDVSASFSDDGIVWLGLQVLDLSVGGIGVLVSEDLLEKGAGDKLRLRLELPIGSSEILGTIRHISRTGICGVQFDGPGDAEQTRIRTAVGELLERGHVA